VDILSAYSWDEGDIYILENDDIELGLYLPIYGYVYDGGDGEVIETVSFVADFQPQTEIIAAIALQLRQITYRACGRR